MTERLTALILLTVSLPLWLLLYLVVKLTSRGAFLFRQQRLGKDSRPFTIYKIRTMVENANDLKPQYAHLNEADGPVFKIHNDPRYTRVGRFISHTGLDELPQLLNIVKGEMAFIGPRPLPVAEAAQVPPKYRRRFSVLPGITSPWVLKGAHSLSFERWMQLDLEYVNNKSPLYDFKIGLQTVLLICNLILKRSNAVPSIKKERAQKERD